METTKTSVSLKCLNCGAKLLIGVSVVEFACEYCGAPQAVERDGGVVALRSLSARVDRVQASVDRSSAELALNRLKAQLDELEEKFNALLEAHNTRKDLVNKLFLGIFFVVCISGFVMSSYASTVVPAIIFGIAGGLGLLLLGKRIVTKMDTDFDAEAGKLIEKGAGVKKRYVEYEKILNS